MGDIEKLTDILMDTLPEHHPWEGEIRKLRDRLIANGVTVRERGRWESVAGVDQLYKCSVCNEWQFIPEEHFAYCPYCGADMRGEEDG